MTNRPRAAAITAWSWPCTPRSRRADMGHEFQIPQEALVEATPEQVWEAIATGPGIDAWFMGRNEVDGGVVRTAFGGAALPGSVVTTADAPHRFTHGSEPAPDGRFVAYDFLIEGRDRGSTSVRL